MPIDTVREPGQAMNNDAAEKGPVQGLVSGWSALKWNYLGNLTRGISQFTIGVLLARLLGPEPFGIVALAWMILGLGRLFADLGFGAALVQRITLSTQELRFISTCQMSFAVLLTGAGVCSAHAIASYFHKPMATPVLQVLFLLFLIDCPGQISAALLRRNLNFKAMQQISIVSYLMGYLVVGLPAAVLGLGEWSLVAAQLTQSMLNSALLLRSAPIPRTPSFHCDTPDIAKFGGKVVAANLSSWVISNLDTVFVGRAFGISSLGLYNRALNLLNTPMSIIATGFQGVLFAACSRSQHDLRRLREIYLETSAVVALVCVPLFATAAAIPRTLILGIYGPEWEASIPLVTPLAFAVLVNVLLAINGPLLMAGNRVGVELRNQLYTILALVPLLLVAIQYSLTATAWAVLAAYLTRWTLLSLATLRFTGASVTEYGRSLGHPVCFGTLIAACGLLVEQCFLFLPPTPRLATVALVCAAVALVLAQHFGAVYVKRNLPHLVKIENLSLPLRKFFHV